MMDAIPITAAHRIALREVERGVPVEDVSYFDQFLELIGAGMVCRSEARFVLTEAGRAYLDAREQAITRRLPRPAPPPLPPGWRQTPAGNWAYQRGPVGAFVGYQPADEPELLHLIEASEARAALYRYLRAVRAYQTRADCDTARPPQCAAVGRDGVDTGDTARTEEPSHLEVTP